VGSALARDRLPGQIHRGQGRLPPGSLPTWGFAPFRTARFRGSRFRHSPLLWVQPDRSARHAL